MTQVRTEPVRVLIVDDSSESRDVCVRLLGRLGYPCEAVTGGPEALEALQRIRYGLVLMDCEMPEMDGFETVAAIRQLERNDGHPPVIALTGLDTEENRTRCLEAGMVDFIAKPFTIKTLKEKLAIHCVSHGESTDG